MILTGKRVKLSPIKRENIDLFLKWFNDPEITQYLVIYRPISREQEEEWLTIMMKDQFNIFFSIELINQDIPGTIIGNCNLGIDPATKNQKAVLGIAIGDKEFWGKGYGTEALELLLEYGFKTLNLNRIELTVYEFNKRAKKAYEKVGFIEEGRCRQSIYINGEFHDVYMMSILHKEWKLKH
jgi:RimJ/RimL family protein N-acetyltransferase